MQMSKQKESSQETSLEKKIVDLEKQVVEAKGNSETLVTEY